MSFDWGVGSDPTGEASVPVFSDISALELYDHDVRASQQFFQLLGAISLQLATWDASLRV